MTSPLKALCFYTISSWGIVIVHLCMEARRAATIRNLLVEPVNTRPTLEHSSTRKHAQANTGANRQGVENGPRPRGDGT